MKLINIGFGNLVSAGRLIAVVSPESAPIKRMVQEARERGVLIDATFGRRTRAVLVMDSDHIVLSAIQPEKVAGRLSGGGAVAVEAYQVGEDVGAAQRYASRFDGGYYTYRHEHDERGHGEKECARTIVLGAFCHQSRREMRDT